MLFSAFKKAGDTVGAKVRISEEKRNSAEELLTKRIKCEMKHEGERRFISNECEAGEKHLVLEKYLMRGRWLFRFNCEERLVSVPV